MQKRIMAFHVRLSFHMSGIVNHWSAYAKFELMILYGPGITQLLVLY